MLTRNLPEACQLQPPPTYIAHATCSVLFTEKSIITPSHIASTSSLQTQWWTHNTGKRFYSISIRDCHIHMVTGQQVASAYFGTNGGLWSASRTCICGLVLLGEVVSPADGRRGETGKVSLWISKRNAKYMIWQKYIGHVQNITTRANDAIFIAETGRKSSDAYPQ